MSGKTRAPQTIEWDREQRIQLVENRIGQTFRDKKLLLTALTHASYQEQSDNNERLEFLGDAVIELVISEYLFTHFRQLQEGQLTRLRAEVVCTNSLSKCAKRLDLGEYLLLGKGEQLMDGDKKPSILADAFEAVTGAIFLDQGIQNAKEFILENLKEHIDLAFRGELNVDYKTSLQEYLYKLYKREVSYKIEREEGPDHNKKFFAVALCGDKLLAKGEGRSKKEAHQQAAKNALEHLKNIENN